MKLLSNKYTSLIRNLVPGIMLLLCIFVTIAAIYQKSFIPVIALAFYIIIFFFAGGFTRFLNLAHVTADIEKKEFIISIRKKISRLPFTELISFKLTGRQNWIELSFTDRKVTFLPANGNIFSDKDDVIFYIETIMQENKTTIASHTKVR